MEGSGCRTFSFGIAFDAIDGGYHTPGIGFLPFMATPNY